MIKTICCNNGDKLPKLECVESRCRFNNCGYKWLLLAFNQHPNTHNFVHCKITYDQIEIVEKTDKGKAIYGVRQHSLNYSDFIDAYIASFKKYIIHHCTYIWQHMQKMNLLSSIPKTAILTRWDYINNPKVEYYYKTNYQCGQISKFASLIGVDNGTQSMTLNQIQ